jgi:NAD-dependent DNA ligase
MSTPTEVMLAHQYLYYVLGRPVLSDHEYDLFCKRHGLRGNGGSDLEDDYTDTVKQLAREMTANRGN